MFGKQNEAIESGAFPRSQPNRMPQAGLKPKDLVGLPWRVAFALQSAGWWLRNDIVWSKPNSLPESVRDRCTRSHEYVFHMAKGRRYFYDANAITEPISEASWKRIREPGLGGQQGGFKQDQYAVMLTLPPQTGRVRIGGS
jgi:hypothetical protein